MISNALKFTEAGEVRVSARSSPDSSLCFSVTDSGVGIAADDWRRFFRSSRRSTTGCKGKCEVRDWVCLCRANWRLCSVARSMRPVHPAWDRPFRSLFHAARRQTIGKPGSRENTILIIDDEEASRYITRQLFRGSKYRIIEARNGPEGTERTRFEHPALILLDLMMPYQNGFNVLDELQSDEATRDIPVVIQTSKTLTQIDYERLASRQATVLPKAGQGRLQALTMIRQILGEPGLFSEEPEFLTSGQQVL